SALSQKYVAPDGSGSDWTLHRGIVVPGRAQSGGVEIFPEANRAMRSEDRKSSGRHPHSQVAEHYPLASQSPGPGQCHGAKGARPAQASVGRWPWQQCTDDRPSELEPAAQTYLRSRSDEGVWVELAECADDPR